MGISKGFVIYKKGGWDRVEQRDVGRPCLVVECLTGEPPYGDIIQNYCRRIPLEQVPLVLAKISAGSAGWEVGGGKGGDTAALFIAELEARLQEGV